MFKFFKKFKRSKKSYRLVNFPDDSYGVEYTNSEGEVFFLDENCTPRHSIYEMKEYCRFNKLSEAEQVLMWGQKKFPSTVIKEG